MNTNERKMQKKFAAISPPLTNEKQEVQGDERERTGAYL
ncbi:hypothetical protein BSG1_10573 [Bacillus sp. SG-1]|nr:hypothetical protein BSG1_10573 [Bacillus sp. SG-1]